ncbi:MAG: hypothetical protein ACI9Z4_001990 [Polaribacter sp.]|jgi:hypothetical protein
MWFRYVVETYLVRALLKRIVIVKLKLKTIQISAERRLEERTFVI